MEILFNVPCVAHCIDISLFSINAVVIKKSICSKSSLFLIALAQ